MSDAAEAGRHIDAEVAVADLARQRAAEGDVLDLLAGPAPRAIVATIATKATPATAPTSLMPIRMLPPDNRFNVTHRAPIPGRPSKGRTDGRGLIPVGYPQWFGSRPARGGPKTAASSSPSYGNTPFPLKSAKVVNPRFSQLDVSAAAPDADE